MALGRYAIGEGMTLSLAARADQRSLFAGLTSIVQRTVFFALAAAAPHASIVSRLSRARLAAATIPSQLAGDARCLRCVPASHGVGSASARVALHSVNCQLSDMARATRPARSAESNDPRSHPPTPPHTSPQSNCPQARH